MYWVRLVEIEGPIVISSTVVRAGVPVTRLNDNPGVYYMVGATYKAHDPTKEGGCVHEKSNLVHKCGS